MFLLRGIEEAFECDEIVTAAGERPMAFVGMTAIVEDMENTIQL